MQVFFFTLDFGYLSLFDLVPCTRYRTLKLLCLHPWLDQLSLSYVHRIPQAMYLLHLVCDIHYHIHFSLWTTTLEHLS
jgi:hypothetical protein